MSFKSIQILAVSLVMSLGFSAQAAAPKYKAYFSPYEGKEAFAEVFKQISNAKTYAYITVYSWSMRGSLEDAIQSACDNGAEVFVVINNDQQESAADKKAGKVKKLITKKKDVILPLLKSCAMFKYTNKTMHEKFVVVDDVFAMNTSANFSSGAISRYSENFVMVYDGDSANESSDFFINALKKEFEVLYNYSKDPEYAVYESTPLLELTELNGSKLTHEPNVSEYVSFYSTSMNKEYSLKKTVKEGSALSNYTVYDCKKNGKAYRTTRKKNCDDSSKATKSQVVVDMVAKEVRSAKHSVFLGVNYLIHDTVCDAVADAVKKGLDVRIITDNKQIKSRTDCTRVLSERYKKKPEISGKFRYKMYSHSPSRFANFLQHHKYILIDYQEDKSNPVSEDTKLISGSHNISYKAENSNFENMVRFETKEFSDLYKSFYKDFMYLYGQGRTKSDKPRKEILNSILKSVKGKYKIHFNSEDDVIALTYKEYSSLKRRLLKLAPGMLDYSTPKEVLENCQYYNPKTKRYSGGSRCNP